MLDELWKTNVGSGFSAPPMTFEVDSKQYVAIASGPSGGGGAEQARADAGAQGQRNATVLWVFGL